MPAHLITPPNAHRSSLPTALRQWLRRCNCRVCGLWQDQAVCKPCRQQLSPARTRCIRCGLSAPHTSHEDLTCDLCRDYPPEMDAVIVGTDFAPPWSGLISGLKFRQQPASALPLVDMLVDAILSANRSQHAHPTPDLIVPIPLAPNRWQERGFNQAWWLAQQVAGQLKLTNRLHANTLLRQHDTGRLMSMKAGERLGCIHGAFTIAAEERHRVEGQHVVIVDDVMTTGATANEASRCLLDAGAASVTGWFATRTPAPKLSQSKLHSVEAHPSA